MLIDRFLKNLKLKKLVFVNGIFIIAIGIPALTRVILNFSVKFIGGIDAVGKYANDYNISMIIATVTATGFSAVVLNRLPGKHDREKSGHFKLILKTCSLVLLIELGIVFVIGEFIIVESYLGSLLLILGYTYSQLIRNYFLAQHNYISTVIFEVITILTVGLLMIGIGQDYLIIHGSTLLIISFVFIFLNLKSYKAEKGIAQVLKHGTAFGLSNLASSFLFYISVPIAHNFLGAEFSGLVGLVNPLLSILLLIPRSLNTHYAPVLVNYLKDDKLFNSTFRQLRLYAFYSLIGIALLCVSTFFVIRYFFFSEDKLLEQATTIVLLLILNVVATQVSLPYSTLLMVKNKSKLMLLLNVVMGTAFFLVMQFYISNLDGFNAYITIYTVLIILNIGKYFYLKFKCE